MTDKINTGGPAFPNTVPQGRKDSMGIPYGMDLRDWFAGQFFAALLSRSDITGNADSYALRAYGQADAMLKVRGQQP